MKKAKPLMNGDKVAIVSLSGGMLGEAFCQHDIGLAEKRLREFGLEMVMMPNTLKGIDYLRNYPEARADDLKRAFADDSVKGIICAIGGDDTYTLLPYLLEDPTFIQNVQDSPKIFTGFSDTTVNHLMFYKLGLVTYYGPNLINDLAELADEMLPYTKEAFGRYLQTSVPAPIVSSDIWYEERTDFSPKSIGTSRVVHSEKNGFELIHGDTSFHGRLLGGCLDTIYDLLTGTDHPDAKTICDTYSLFPPSVEWKGNILFIETSENCMSPAKLSACLSEIERRGIFSEINGILVGKPQNEIFYEEYKAVYRETMSAYPQLPILYNINFGHAYPRTVLPYGIEVTVDVDTRKIHFVESITA